jgi:hypothetical protein
MKARSVLTVERSAAYGLGAAHRAWVDTCSTGLFAVSMQSGAMALGRVSFFVGEQTLSRDALSQDYCPFCIPPPRKQVVDYQRPTASGRPTFSPVRIELILIACVFCLIIRRMANENCSSGSVRYAIPLLDRRSICHAFACGSWYCDAACITG